MLRPGKYWPGTQIDLDIVFTDEDGALVDPSTVMMTIMDPYGRQTAYAYLTDSELTKNSTGSYTCVVIPDKPGRWHFRWVGGTTVAEEGNFNVKTSPFWDSSNYWDYCT